jgi:response regulator RpfG family c-di-GMP phosphodiesterase
MASSAPRLRLVTDGQHRDVAALAEGLRGHGYDIPPLPHDDGRSPHEVHRRAHLVLYRLARPPGVTWSAEGDGSGAEAPAAQAVVYLVDHASEAERIAALDDGADDVVVLPVSVPELAARLRAVLRRSHSSVRRSLLTHADVALDLVAGQATRSGRRLSLTRKEFRLLQVLMEHRGRPVSRRELIEAVWGPGRHLDARTVDANIHRLRTNIGDGDFEIIRTVHTVGYMIEI